MGVSIIHKLRAKIYLFQIFHVWASKNISASTRLILFNYSCNVDDDSFYFKISNISLILVGKFWQIFTPIIWRFLSNTSLTCRELFTPYLVNSISTYLKILRLETLIEIISNIPTHCLDNLISFSFSVVI